MRVLLTALLLLLTALAGCSDAPDEDPGSGENDDLPDNGDTTEGEESEESGLQIIGPISGTLYFTTSEELSVQEQPAGSIAIPAAASSTWGGASNGNVLRFVSPEFDLPAIIQPDDLEVKFWVETSAPIPASGFYDFGAWIGSSLNMGSSATATFGPGVFTPGTQNEVTITPSMPAEEGIFVPAGERFVVEVGTGLLDENSGSVQLLIGPDYPSHVQMSWTLLSEDILEGVSENTVETFTGHVNSQGTVQFFTGVQPEQTSFDHTISIPADAKIIRVDSTATSTGRADIDMVIRASNTVLGASLAFYSDEAIVLAGPLLEPYLGTDLTLTVNIYLGNNVDYSVELSTG